MASNSEIIRALYAAFAKGDIPAVLGTLSADVSWTDAEGFPYGGTYIGPDAVLNNVFMKLGAEWHGFSAVPKEFIAEGDTVVAVGDYGGTYKATGKSFSAPFAHVWNLRNGSVVRFRQFTDTVLAQNAVRNP
jgi:ketosteroid isomerase-like protein